MSQALQSNPSALVESVARNLPPSARDDFRNLMNETVLANLTALSPGGNLLQIGGVKAGSSAPPVGVTHSVAGANTQLSVSISNPPTPQGQPIWHEFSYSPLKSFVSNDTTTLEPTTATSFQVPAVGQTVYTRLRSSYDKVNWSPYQLSSTSPTNAGLLSSAATAPGGAFNQTNFAEVNSQTSGGITTVSVNGAGGTYTPYTAVKGAVESTRPSATIVGVELGSSQFLGWDGSQFQISPTLAGAFPDDLEPVGAITVGSGTPGGGGTSGGNGGRMTAV
jgi:hypothetical protein